MGSGGAEKGTRTNFLGGAGVMAHAEDARKKLIFFDGQKKFG